MDPNPLTSNSTWDNVELCELGLLQLTVGAQQITGNNKTAIVYFTGKKMHNKSVLTVSIMFDNLYYSMNNKIEYSCSQDVYKPGGEVRHIRHKYVKEKKQYKQKLVQNDSQIMRATGMRGRHLKCTVTVSWRMCNFSQAYRMSERKRFQK